MRDIGTLRLHLLFIGMVLLTVLGAWGIADWHQTLQIAPKFERSMLVPEVRGMLWPKPTEQFVFLTLALAVPTAIFAIGLWLFRRPKVDGVHRLILVASVLCSVAVLVLPFLSFDFDYAFIGSTAFVEHELRTFSVTFALACASCWWCVRRAMHPRVPVVKWSWLAPGDAFWNRLSWTLLLGITALQIGAWRIYGINAVTLDPIWSVHAEAFLYSVSQVVAGKTLLVDLPSQYGLFALFLKPFLLLIGASVLSLTNVFALMQLICMSALYGAIRFMVRNPLSRLAALLALITMTFNNINIINGHVDPYFQYWPIRFFWPAVSLFACCRYTAKPSLSRSATVSLAASIGALWNLDTGLVIVIAYTGMLVARGVALSSAGKTKTAEFRHTSLAITLHLATFAICVAAVMAFLTLSAEAPLNVTWLFGYQKIFYGLGFGMLPLPLRIHPWMSVIGIYLMSVVVAVRMMTTNPASRHANVILFLALTGLGLFVYYEGRSNLLNLMPVCWPAIALSAILGDRCLRAVRARLLGKVHLSHALAALCLLILLSAGVLSGLGNFASRLLDNFMYRQTIEEPRVADELAFIREHTRPGDECLILSLRQGIYHLESGTSSPIQGPGYVETILQKDLDAFTQQLSSQQPACIFLGLGEGSELPASFRPDTLNRNYDRADINPMRTMALLRRKLN